MMLAREDERILNRYFNAIYYKSVILLFCGRSYVYWLDCARFGHLASGTSSEKLMDFQSIQPWLADLPNRKEFFYTHYVPEIEKAVKRMKPFDGTELDLATFYAFNVPSLLVSRIPEQGGGKRFEVLTNPRLQSIDFVRRMDPFTAFQSIETFIGSVIGRADEIPYTVGSDEVIARQKGFDEHSFRTMAPGLKKLHRKVNRNRKKGLS